jgi:hypothetical protein
MTSRQCRDSVAALPQHMAESLWLSAHDYIINDHPEARPQDGSLQQEKFQIEQNWEAQITSDKLQFVD